MQNPKDKKEVSAYNPRQAKQSAVYLFDVMNPADTSEEYRVALRQALKSTFPPEEEMAHLPKRPTNVSGRKYMYGVVVSAKMDKTIVVRSDRQAPHSLYVKSIRRTKKFHAHDEFNLAREGDFVRIVETRPISKMKCWRLEEIVRRPGLMTALPSWLRTPPMVRLSIPGFTGSHLQQGHRYSLHIHLEHEQYLLFEKQMTDNQQFDEHDDSKQDTISPSHNIFDLVIRLGGPRFETKPSIATIRSGQHGPIIEPRQVDLTPIKNGLWELNLSILLASTGELIQSQTFKLPVD